MKFIKNNDLLKCSAGINPAPCSGSSNVKINSMPVIRQNNTSIKGTFGLCKNQPIPNPPGFLPCTPTISGMWNQSKNNVKNKLPVCTEKSYMMCSFGGKITPVTKSLNVGDGASSVSLSSVSLFTVGTYKISEKSKSNKLSSNQLDNLDIDTNKKLNNSKLQNDKNRPNNNSKNNNKIEICPICGLPKDDKHNNIYIRKSIEDLNNDSKILRNNMLSGNDNLAKSNKIEIKYLNDKMKNLTGLTYNVDSEAASAHHIISGNQILKKYPELIGIALGAGYDINCKENGIFLPTLTDKTKEKLKFHKRKSPVAYDVMAETKRQWHLGGHSYNTKTTNIQFGNYVDEVSKLLNLLEKKWLSRIVCKNDKNQDKQIISDLNSISSKIRKYLNNFQNDPKTSKPFYVSKVALEFAYSLSKTINLIIYDISDSIKVKKYKYKNKSLYKINEKAISLNKIDDFIRFCGNAKNFISFDNQINKEFFPFSEIKEHILFLKKNRNHTIDEIIKVNKFDIITFLKQFSYENTRTIIQRRLEEIR